MTKRHGGKVTRAVHLKEGSKQKILDLLDGWRGPLTWELFLDAVEKVTGHRYTRQTLHNHERIRLAWITRKSIYSKEAKENPKGSFALITARERIGTLEATIARLEAETQAYRAMFARWAYNAALNGIDIERLNQALPPIDREMTKLNARHTRGSGKERL